MTKEEKTALISAAVNLVLNVVKFILASASGSIALLADAYHSLSDVLSSLFVFLAVRLEHRHHHRRRNARDQASPETTGEEQQARPPRIWSGRWDTKAAMSSGILLVAVAIGIFLKIVSAPPLPLRHPWLCSGILLFLALCSYLLYRFEAGVGEEHGSHALVADGHHSRSDMLATFLVIASLISDRLGFRLDRVAATVIGLFILADGVQILRSGWRTYLAARRGELASDEAVVEESGEVVLEDRLVGFLQKVVPLWRNHFWRWVSRLPGMNRDPRVAEHRFLAYLSGVGLTIAVLGYLGSGLFIVRTGEQAIVEHFGQPRHLAQPLGPGLHYHWPWPVEVVRRVDTGTISRLAIGYKAAEADQDFILWTNQHYREETPFLTGENSFLSMAVNIHYQVSEVEQYLYRVGEPETLLEQVAYQVLREEVGQRGFFDAATGGREQMEREILQRLQAGANRQQLGLRVLNVCLRDLHPPTEVAPAFEDVVSAQEDYETDIEVSRGYAADLLPKARSEAYGQVCAASAFRETTMAKSEGESAAYVAQLAPYRDHRALTEKRLLLETLEENLPAVKKYVVYPATAGNRPSFLFRLPSAAVPRLPELPQEVPAGGPEGGPE